MSIESITAAAVRETLRALAKGRTNLDTPLTSLAQVAARLRDDRLVASPELKLLALERVIRDAITDELARMLERRGDDRVAMIQSGIALDGPVVPSSREIEAWAALHARFVAMRRGPANDLGRMFGITGRTFYRRLEQGYPLLADVLRHREYDALGSLDEAGAWPQS